MDTILIDGGLGKNLCAAEAVYSLWLQTEEKVNVITGWVDAWRNHPAVEALGSLGDPHQCHHLYVKGRVFRPEPYGEKSYRVDQQHIIAVYRELLGCEDPHSQRKNIPFYQSTSEEEDWADNWLANRLREENVEGKPMIAIMPFGAGFNTMGQVRSFDIPTAQYLADLLNEKGYAVFQFRGQLDPKLRGTIAPDMDIRFSLGLMTRMPRVICVDTWLQHMAAAMFVPCLVFFGATSKERLGYDTHVNIRKDCPIGPCYRPELTLPDPFVCPFDRDCMRWTNDEVRMHVENFLK